MIGFTIFSPFSVYIIEKYGIRISLILALAIQMLGCVLRSMVGKGFIFLTIGQTLTVSVGPLITNMATKVSANWFPKDQRVVATNVAITFYNVGSGIGYLLPIMFVDSGWEELTFKENSQDQIQNMFNFMVAI